MNVQHMRFGMLSAVLVVCTLMIGTIDLSQNFVFAQNTTSTLLPSQLPAQDSTSTPATPASGNNDESLSSDANDNSNSNADETASSSGSADDANNSEDSDSQQDTSSNTVDDSDDSVNQFPILQIATMIHHQVMMIITATTMIATMNLLAHRDLLTMITTAKIVTHNKTQHRVMATAVGRKMQHRVKKKMRLKIISSR